tara:strand:- start:81 stop:290 length:210 start_codon:yes stop_codon:yes gene_type:complete
MNKYRKLEQKQPLKLGNILIGCGYVLTLNSIILLFIAGYMENLDLTIIFMTIFVVGISCIFIPLIMDIE